MNNSTVYRHIQRLLADKTIKILAVTEPVEAGFPIGVVLGITATPGQAPGVVEGMVRLRNVRFVSTTTGRFDILAFALFHSDTDLADFVGRSLRRISGIVDASAFKCLKIAKGSRLQYKANEGSLDGKIIGNLRRDGRQSYKAIAANLNVKPMVVYRRLNRLQRQGLLRITAVVDVNRIGNRIVAVIGINTLGGREDVVCSELSKLDNAVMVTQTTGIFSIFTWMHFPAISDLYQFLENTLGRIDGVKLSETFLCLKVAKGVYINL
jgi:Lrp/AsnC family transcriptional regulator for asnA, asnC and gidA